MVPCVQPGLELTWICEWPGCSKGTTPWSGRYDQDLKREQVRTRIQRLLAVAASTNFTGEAESARALATGLAAKHSLSF